MKLNLEIEVDWIDDEMTIDDTVKQSIVNEVVRTLDKKVSEKLEKEIEKKVDQTIIKKIDEKVDRIFTDFINKDVTLNDKYGDVLKQYGSVMELIKEKFDSFLIENVDDNGKTKRDNYGRGVPRIDFLITNQLKKFSDKFTTDTVKTVSAEIKRHVEDGLTTKLGAELMRVLKVDKMLKIEN